MNDLDHIRIEKMSDDLWRTWIPASRPEHRYEDGSDIGVYGNVYHQSLQEAIVFLAMSAWPVLRRDGWEPKFLPYPDE